MNKVSIILPVYNVMPHLKVMIQMLYNSTKFPFRLIIIDGFSTDGTAEYCKELENDNVRFYQIPKKGLVNAINFGIEKAGDDDVYLTQADVIHYRLYGRDWLHEMNKLGNEKNMGMITSTAGWGESGPDFVDGFRWLGTWNTYITRHAINKIGVFDEQFSGGDDIDYTYRVKKAKLRIVITDYWVQHHQLTDRNMSHDDNHLKEMYVLLRKKWGIKDEKKIKKN